MEKPVGWLFGQMVNETQDWWNSFGESHSPLHKPVTFYEKRPLDGMELDFLPETYQAGKLDYLFRRDTGPEIFLWNEPKSPVSSTFQPEYQMTLWMLDPPRHVLSNKNQSNSSQSQSE